MFHKLGHAQFFYSQFMTLPGSQHTRDDQAGHRQEQTQCPGDAATQQEC